MNFVFPVFVRASNDTTPPAPPQKSLWELVAEAGPNDAIPGRVAVPRVTRRRDKNNEDEKNECESWREKGDDVAAAFMPGDTASRAADDAMASRSSWTPVMYMAEHLMSSGFVSQFAMLHGIECSARLPPPPCLRPQDLQLPPLVLARLQRQLCLPRPGKGSLPADCQNYGTRPNLRELREIVFGGAAIPSCNDGDPERFAADCAREDVDDCGDYMQEEFVLTALQQFTATSMLLGHHTLSVGPRGVGKRPIGFLATGALTLARVAEKANNMTWNKDKSLGQINTTAKEGPGEALLMRQPAPHAVIIVSSYNEVHKCNQWLQGVFTAGAFTPMTFRRGAADLVPLPIVSQEDLFGDHVSLKNEALLQLLTVPSPVPVVTLQKEGQPPSHHSRDPDDGYIAHKKRHRHYSRERRGRSRQSSGHNERKRHRRHRSSSRHRSRSRSRSHRRRRGGSHRSHHGRRRSRRDDDDDNYAARRRRSSRGERRHRSRSRSRRPSRDRKREKKEKEKGRDDNKSVNGREQIDQIYRSHYHGQEKSHDEMVNGSSCPQELVDNPHKFLDVEAKLYSTGTCSASNHAAVSCGEIPFCLQCRVPILIVTQQSLVEALQLVQGQAEVLPLESVRIVCISDADRIAQPVSQACIPTSWWVSFSNAVDVECQYIVSASRMYDEVDGWLRETLLRETPDVVNRYRQRDDTVWCGVDHLVEAVRVVEEEEDEEKGRRQRAVQQFFERVDAAKIGRLFDIILQHFSLAHAGSVDNNDTVMHRHGNFGNSGGNNSNENNDSGDKASLPSLVGRLVVVVASRREQEFVFQQLSSGLEKSAACVCCTCSLQDFQRGEADVLVAYDWMLCSFDDEMNLSGRPVEKVVNFSFPRALMAPGKEESLLECIMIRARTLLHHKEFEESNNGKVGDDLSSFAVGTRLSVVTLLTDRQINGRIGRLLTLRAQAQTSV